VLEPIRLEHFLFPELEVSAHSALESKLLSMFDTIDTINTEMRRCTRCDLSIGRTQVVIPNGDLQSKVALIGHAPSGTDDATGRPYTGPAGEVLEELLFKVGLRRSQFYISNLVTFAPVPISPQNCVRLS
jgi:uracil-DNA glycosylase